MTCVAPASNAAPRDVGESMIRRAAAPPRPPSPTWADRAAALTPLANTKDGDLLGADVDHFEQ